LALHDAIIAHNDEVRAARAAGGGSGSVVLRHGYGLAPTAAVVGASASPPKTTIKTATRRRRLAHQNYSKPSPQFGRPAMLIALLAAILFVVGSSTCCYYSSYSKVEEAYHQNKKLHRMAYIGCPCSTCIGTGIYVLFVLISLTGAIVGSMPPKAGLPPSAPAAPAPAPSAMRATCPKAPGPASAITMPNAPGGGCCAIGSHPSWVESLPGGGLSYSTKPFTPLTCEGVMTGTLDSCSANNAPCSKTPPPGGLGAFLSAAGFKSWLLGMIGFVINAILPPSGLALPIKQSAMAMEIDILPHMGQTKYGPLEFTALKVYWLQDLEGSQTLIDCAWCLLPHSPPPFESRAYGSYGALGMPHQLHKFIFPMSFKVDSLDRFGFDAKIGTGSGGVRLAACLL
jgi:hypothetical protein